jgi:hypothetical protein
MSKSTTMKTGAAPRKAAKQAPDAPAWTGKRKWLVAGAALVVVIGGLVVVARPGAVSAPPEQVQAAAPSGPRTPGQLRAIRTRYNFGTVSMARGKVTTVFRIANTGSDPVVIRKLYTSCMCTTAALVKNGKSSDAFGMAGHTPIPTIDVPLTSKDDAAIEVVFDPAAHGPAGVGPIERVVTVENSAGEPLELQFAALVTP